MAPRATVKQAIEFLKIHQIRRENAAIYQQIKELRDEVSDLHDANDETWKELDHTRANVEDYQKLSTQHKDQVKKLTINIESIAQKGEATRAQLENTRDQQTHDVRILQNQYNLIEAAVDKLESEQKARKVKGQSTNQTFCNELEDLRLQLAQKAYNKQVEAITVRLDQLEREAQVSKSKRDSAASTDCVFESIEDSRQLTLGVPEKLSRDHNQSSPNGHTSATQRFDSDFMLTFASQHKSRGRTLPDDLDLDEATLSTCNGHQATDTIPENNSLIMLPDQIDDEDLVDRVLSLKQHPQETLEAYMKRGYDLMENLPEQAEKVVFRRLLENFLDVRHQQSLTKWLNATSWSRSNLDDALSLLGINRSGVGEAYKAIRIVGDPSPIQENLPQVLVSATDSIEQAAPLPTTRPAKKKQRRPLEPRVGFRRSQRLVEKSRMNSRSQQGDANIEVAAKASSTIATRTIAQHKEHSKTSIVRPRAGASAAPQRIDRKSVVEQPRKRKRIENELHARKNVSANLPADIPTEDAAVMFQASDLTQTPTRRIFRGKSLHQPPHKPHPTPTTPYFGQRNVFQVRQPQLNQLVEIVNPPSPYQPRPRLVSAEQRTTVVRPLPNHTSDPDVILPQVKYQARDKADVAHKEHDVPATKKRRVPRPPPPPIPILSTSTEEDRRFDKW